MEERSGFHECAGNRGRKNGNPDFAKPQFVGIVTSLKIDEFLGIYQQFF